MKIYLVGGAVRDGLLGLEPVERDWVVVGATPVQMLAQGFRPVNGDFPVFLHPDSGEEYALARREFKTGPGYRGFRFEASPEVSLEEDLARRDLTINAIARDGVDGALIDPFDGQGDLDQGLLRHVTPAFVEDPLRVLRIARFAARLGRWGFHVAHGTQGLLRRMVAGGELQTLSGERVWKETARALTEAVPGRYFQVLARCGALAVVLPELTGCLADSAGHGANEPSASLEALARAADLSGDPGVRLAALLAGLDETALASWRRRLHPPRVQMDLAVVAHRCRPGSERPEALSQALGCADALRRGERFEHLLRVWRALGLSSGAVGRLAAARAAMAAVTAEALAGRGLSGAELGRQLVGERRRVAQAVLQKTE